MASLYLCEDLDAAIGDRLTLTGLEARHAVTVNRTRPGERILIGNGRGLIAAGEVLVATGSELTIDVDALERVERHEPTITLVQALAKGDRDERAIQAATELGADAVIPWAAARSVSRWEGTKIAKGRERWATIVREAGKQSVRAWTPEVGELSTTRQIAALAVTHRVLVLDPSAGERLTDVTPDARPLALVVGPEGGIDPAELDVFRAAGAEFLRLGDTILRTSTAGPAALAVLSAATRRW
ncbi:16S ribosomal RNA methyltransferase RsmE [Leifsonia xyli subsp. cynodontis DSM 46306]|uniref:Ribosomal RNA small subunit methyltransferase E n=1 Tax=Leifsonia xyli subsp. cynodontis DSM 46306 TaxID=1389489 RepID=U3P6R3_LEIXC|nr:16S rRNA (uracil(1498)-N(3))-methyltransferase [Leifsonia xyli]AGW41491.1 16S ribosomal RNA methyltransferase RsmE [Leifsonia xyli subsp. cynodontis DSM 46306]